MQKQNLTQASRELFRRAPDERFASLDDLWRHCQDSRDRSTDRWHSPTEIRTVPTSSRLDLLLGGEENPIVSTTGAFRRCASSQASARTR
jgi:hypothetical protein